MKCSSNKLLTLFISAVLVFSMISLVLMTSPTAAQDEKSKELTFTDSGAYYYIENDYVQIRVRKAFPSITWHSKETGATSISFEVIQLIEYFDKSQPEGVYDQGDTIYRTFALNDPNLLSGSEYEIAKTVTTSQVTLTYRARGDILDMDDKDVGNADVSFVFKIYATGGSAQVYSPQDGVEMAIETSVSDWEYLNEDNDFLALSTTLGRNAADSATVNGKTVQTMDSYQKMTPSSGYINVISVYNSTNTQMGYLRLANRDNQDATEEHSYMASENTISIMSTYLNIGKTHIHQMSLGVPESLSSPTDQDTGGFGFGDIGSIFQGLPGIFSNILFIEVLVVVVVLAIIVIVLVRRVKRAD